jgi:hypothetical protein
VEFGGCNDCHTPGYFLGKPDMSRYLSGSEIGFEMPGTGVFVGPVMAHVAVPPVMTSLETDRAHLGSQRLRGTWIR